jgi:putative ABC transport system permease protein
VHSIEELGPWLRWVAAGTADGVKVADAQAALEVVTSDFPQVDVQTSTEYRESIEAQIDQLLSIVNVMLALAIVIALIGIGLTLALSVFERTREIGLLRAVGMSTRQVRRMIRWEAALIAIFGAVFGVSTCLLYGWGTVTALPESIAGSVSVATMRVGLLVLASAIAGLFAALLPARRAARMNVLDAITGR